jgi:hypothetical protein
VYKKQNRLSAVLLFISILNYYQASRATKHVCMHLSEASAGRKIFLELTAERVNEE